MWDNTPEEIPPGTGAVLTVPEFGDYGDLMPSANTSELAYAYDPKGKCSIYAFRKAWFLIVADREATRVKLGIRGREILLVHYGERVHGKRVFTTELDPLAETLREKFGT